MSKLPIRRQQFKTGQFLAWLNGNGAEVGKPTNPYEVVRYKAYNRHGGKPQTHIVYAKENGLLTFTGETRQHYENFLSDLPLQSVTFADIEASSAADKAEAESVTARRRKRLVARDGDGCWFCGEQMGEDMTLEHLLARSKGGSNDQANLVLAHRDCNNRAANLSVAEKVELRSRMRTHGAVA